MRHFRANLKACWRSRLGPLRTPANFRRTRLQYRIQLHPRHQDLQPGRGSSQSSFFTCLRERWGRGRGWPGPGVILRGLAVARASAHRPPRAHAADAAVSMHSRRLRGTGPPALRRKPAWAAPSPDWSGKKTDYRQPHLRSPAPGAYRCPQRPFCDGNARNGLKCARPRHAPAIAAALPGNCLSPRSRLPGRQAPPASASFSFPSDR